MEKELVRVIKILNKHKIKYMLIGGYAVVLYGVRRSTFDIDIAIALDTSNIKKAVDLLHKLGFREKPSIIQPIYGMRFNYNGVDLDLMFIENPRFDIIYRYHDSIKYKDTVIKVPNIMDLVSIKESSIRDKDISDAIELRNIANLRRK